MTYRVMTVCTGNICRSPMAEIVLRQRLEAAGLADEVVVDSSGVSDEEHGHPVDRRARSVLAARAARRVAEAIRRASGRTALAGDADHLLPVLEAARPRDVFDDPFADTPPDRRPALLVLDDGSQSAFVREQRGRLLAAAADRGIRVETLDTEATSEVGCYASLLLSGTYAAAYLSVGLVEE